MRLILLILSMILANQIQGNLGTVHAAEVYSNLSFFSPPAEIDGVALVTDRKYLLAAQTDASQNGIWRYTGHSFLRPIAEEQLQTGFVGMMMGSEVFVRSGTVHGGEKFRLVSSDSDGIDGYENSILTVGYAPAFFRRVGNRPGDIVTSFQTTYPGALLLDGVSTIGKAGSGATYTGPHLEAAFEVIKNIAPNSGLVFSAGDTAVLFDARGRVIAGRDNMGGSAANRLTSAASGFDGSALGAAGGAQTHTLTTAEMPEHTHQVWGGLAGGSGTARAVLGASSGNANQTSDATGGGEAHRNVQPTFVANFFLCL